MAGRDLVEDVDRLRRRHRPGRRPRPLPCVAVVPLTRMRSPTRTARGCSRRAAPRRCRCRRAADRRGRRHGSPRRPCGSAVEMVAEIARRGQERRAAVFVAAVAGDAAWRRPARRRSARGPRRRARRRRARRLSARCSRSPSRAPTITARHRRLLEHPARRDVGDRHAVLARHLRRPPPGCACSTAQPPTASMKRRYFILLQSPIRRRLVGAEPALRQEAAGRACRRPAARRRARRQNGVMSLAGAPVEQREADLVRRHRQPVPHQQRADGRCRSW